jgi:hypothetical protein
MQKSRRRGVKEATTASSSRSSLVRSGFKVGPMPQLPPLPQKPYPYVARCLLTDGRIAPVDGFVVGLHLDGLVRQGLARMIPYGLKIETDAEKLWLLGREKFAPTLTRTELGFAD